MALDIRGWLVCVPLALLVACDESLPKITLITQMEGLGPRVEVADDPSRSSPERGESFTYEPLLAFPELDPDIDALSMLLIDCTMPSRSLGVPICQEFIDAALSDSENGGMSDPSMLDTVGELTCDRDFSLRIGGVGVHCQRGRPRVSMAVPAQAPAADRLLRGMICNGGTAVFDPNSPALFGCQGEPVDALPFHDKVWLASDVSEHNTHPDEAGLSLQFDGSDWQPWQAEQPPSAGDCAAADSGLQQAFFEEEARVKLLYDAGLREQIDGEPELIEVSTYATAGEMERRFTVFPSDAKVFGGNLLADFTWTAPTVAHNEALQRRESDDPVHFFVTLTDRRGGFARLDRYLCLRE